MQVVVSQNGDCSASQIFHEPQRLERFGTAINQIARQPEAVILWVEIDLVEQASERIVTSLDIADCVNGQSILPP